MQGAGYIGVIIELRLSDGWANTSPRRQMRDGIEFLAMKEVAHGVVVPQVDLKNRCVTFDGSYVGALDLRIVKIVEFVKNRHAVTKGESLFDKMRPDESGATSDEYPHGAKIDLRMPIANSRLLSCRHTGH